MSENYARENNVKNNSKNDCRNSAGNRASNKNGSNGMNCREPMSKQSAAQRKTDDCDR